MKVAMTKRKFSMKYLIPKLKKAFLRNILMRESICLLNHLIGQYDFIDKKIEEITAKQPVNIIH